ncbi:MAG: polyribonucleotide nucleotidyltransferase [Sulfurimonas sp.]|nr:MAG: polyribonucleotide nucleotidyltransferase [Sulfurimonas sp.]
MTYNEVIELENKVEHYAFNQVARQANGTVWLKSGNAVVLATVVIDETDFVSEEFLPLTVQYIEKTYAVGKFPGGFFKRETKPSDFETLTSRIIDRSLRPLFPKGFANPLQITIMVLSADDNADLQVLALNAASAALWVSDIDINTSVSAVRIGKIGDEVVLNPTMQQLEESTLDLYVSGSKEDLLMIEMRSLGSEEVQMLDLPMMDPMIDPTLSAEMVSEHHCNALSEEELLTLLSRAKDYLKDANTRYETCFDTYSKPCMPLVCLDVSAAEEMIAYLHVNHLDAIKDAIGEMARTERSTALKRLRKEILGVNVSWDEKELKRAIEQVKQQVVRSQILDENRRADGRTATDIRPIRIDTNVLPSAHASALFTRGQTQALVVLTIGGSKDAQMFEKLTDEGTQNETFMVHYNFPGFSVGEPSPVGPPRRRELGHGNLAKRALEPSLIPSDKTLRLVSEIMESNGSSSMATVCGGYMALRAGDIAMSDVIAGVAMGMVSEDDRYAILSDITGLEDHDGDLDCKVSGSKEGITALQMDIKLGGISLEILQQTLQQAKAARSHIIDIMLEAEERIELNEESLPSSDFFHIDPDFVGDIIGQAGKTIREIIEMFEVAIDIDKKQGHVKVTGKNKKGVQGAREHIEKIINSAPEKIQYQVGDEVEGKVKKIVDFGAFIELPGGTDGLLHISKISNERVSKVSDVLSEGDTIKVKIIEFKGNKISLDRA